MRTGVFFALALFLNLGILDASPIHVPITSSKKLEELGIDIEFQKFEGRPAGSGQLRVKVTWKPTPVQEGEKPEIQVTLHTPDDNEVRMSVGVPPNKEGVCEAHFTLSESDIKNTQLRFSNGPHLARTLDFSEFLNGFENSGIEGSPLPRPTNIP